MIIALSLTAGLVLILSVVIALMVCRLKRIRRRNRELTILQQNYRKTSDSDEERRIIYPNQCPRPMKLPTFSIPAKGQYELIRENGSDLSSHTSRSESPLYFEDQHYNGKGLMDGGGAFTYEFLNLPQFGKRAKHKISNVKSETETPTVQPLKFTIKDKGSVSLRRKDSQRQKAEIDWWLDSTDGKATSDRSETSRGSDSTNDEETDEPHENGDGKPNAKKPWKRVLEINGDGNHDNGNGHHHSDDGEKQDQETDAEREMEQMDHSLEGPTIEFKLHYSTAETKLSVTVLRCVNLPPQFRNNCLSFVKVSLLTHG